MNGWFDGSVAATSNGETAETDSGLGSEVANEVTAATDTEADLGADAADAVTAGSDTEPTHTKPTDPKTTHTEPTDNEPTDNEPSHTTALYSQLRALDREVARLQLRRTEIVAQLMARQAAADLALEPEPTPQQRARAATEARAAVVDSVVAATGGRRGDWEARATFAQAPEPVTRLLREAVAAGSVSFEQASAVVAAGDALKLPTDQRAVIAEAITQYAARRCQQTGASVGQRQFRGKLRRELIKHAGTTTRRRAAHDRRELWIRDEEDSSAVLGIRGADARCVGAYRRIDAIARGLRSDGDARTLAQLRSDIALDLLLFGRSAPAAPTASDHPGDPQAGWPTALVHVVVSAASLLGLSHEPGLVEDTAVAAQTIRRMAYRQDGTWRRIVTDEVTGYAMNAVVKTYRPPGRMARVVRARDGRCRAPGCTRPAATCDLDHVRERHEGGQTCGANLQDLCRLHHSKKTRHHWAAAIADDGRIEWRLPDGRTYATYPMDYRELGRDVVDRTAPQTDESGMPTRQVPSLVAPTAEVPTP